MSPYNSLKLKAGQEGWHSSCRCGQHRQAWHGDLSSIPGTHEEAQTKDSPKSSSDSHVSSGVLQIGGAFGHKWVAPLKEMELPAGQNRGGGGGGWAPQHLDSIQPCRSVTIPSQASVSSAARRG